MKRRSALKNLVAAGGVVAFTTPFITLLQSCQNQQRSTWKPKFMNNDEQLLISNLVDTILPPTETPGGLDVKVDMFIDLVYDQLYDEDGKKMIRQALKEFDQKSISTYGKKFAALTSVQKREILLTEEKQNAVYNPSVWGTGVGNQAPVGFYRGLKSLILWGYFSSEEIGKNVLRYDPIPQAFLGCIPLKQDEKIWSY